MHFPLHLGQLLECILSQPFPEISTPFLASEGSMGYERGSRGGDFFRESCSEIHLHSPGEGGLTAWLVVLG